MIFIYYTIAGLILYVLSDWILGQIEKMRGERFEQRSMIFFVIILVLALTSFKAIEMLTASS